MTRINCWYGVVFYKACENDFWEKSEFFSELKQIAVNDDDYQKF